MFTSVHSDDQNHVVAGPGPSPGRPVRVPATTPDRPLGGIAADLLKIDSEAFELHVLDGARHTLGLCTAIDVEDGDANLRRYGGSSAELRRTLRDAGFTLFRVAADQAVEVPAGEEPEAARTENLLGVKAGAVDAVLGRAALRREVAR